MLCCWAGHWWFYIYCACAETSTGRFLTTGKCKRDNATVSVCGHLLHFSPGVSHLLCFFARYSLSFLFVYFDGFHVMAWWVMVSGGFLNICPSYFHFIFISFSIGNCLVPFQSVVLGTLSDQSGCINKVDTKWVQCTYNYSLCICCRVSENILSEWIGSGNSALEVWTYSTACVGWWSVQPVWDGWWWREGESEADTSGKEE